jgi:HD-like signal output (HDOD) protein
MSKDEPISRLDPELAKQLRDSDRLPTLPAIAIKLINLAQNPDATLTELLALVEQDPATAARVMRRANSAYYGRKLPVETLREAVLFLGLNATLSLALAISLVPVLVKDPIRGLDHEHFWRRSLISAAAARLIGRNIVRGESEPLFLAALLQDIGMLVIHRVFPGTYVMDLREQKDHRRIIEIERSKLQTDHARIGAWLLDHWRMPPRITLAVAASHDTPGKERTKKSDRDKLRPFLHAVAASGLMADLWVSPGDQHRLVQDTGRLGHLLGVGKEDLFEIAVSMSDQVREIEALFDVNLTESIETEALAELMEAQAAGLSQTRKP